MRKEIQLALVTALALQACAPIASNNEGKGGSIEPKDKVFVPTYTPIPPMSTFGVYQTPVYVESSTPTPLAEAQKWPYPYFSQHDYKGNKTIDNCTWSYAGCGIMVGAMITKTDPETYYRGLIKFWDGRLLEESKVFNCKGSSMIHHKIYLESLGYTFKDISTGRSPAEVWAEVKNATGQNIPVWVNTKIWDGQAWIGHHTIAIGDHKFNDPYYGEGVTLEDSQIQEQDIFGRNQWDVYEVIPPVNR